MLTWHRWVMMEKTEAFSRALKKARIMENARIEALFSLNDARALRLEHLRDLIVPDLGGDALAKDLFGLRLEAGEVPRLWLDLTASVIMEPNPRTYRVLEMQQAKQDTLFESDDAKAVHEFALRHLAHRKLLKALTPADKPPVPEINAALKTGLMWLGALALLCSAVAATLVYFGWMTVHFG